MRGRKGSSWDNDSEEFDLKKKQKKGIVFYEDEGEGGSRKDGFDDGDDRGNVEVGEFDEVKNLVLHQLVISYNLSKVSESIVDRVLDHLSKEEKFLRKLEKLEEMVVELSSKEEGGGDFLLKVGVIVIICLQALMILLILMFLRH